MTLSKTDMAIGKVTSLLQEWLTDRANLPTYVGRPEATLSTATNGGLNVFLYEAHFDASMRNLSLQEGQPPPLWLVLRYILTAFDGETPKDSDSILAHEYLGRGIRTLQELSFLYLSGTILDDAGIVPALTDNPEPLKITFFDASVDLLSKIMQGSDEKYRISLPFEVRPVMITTGELPSHSLLVGMDHTQSPITVREEEEKGVHIQVLPGLGPFLSDLSPSCCQVGDTVTLKGSNLDLQELSVGFGPLEFGATAQKPDQLKFLVRDELKEGTMISAGSYPLQVKQKLANNRERNSNLLPISLLPFLETADIFSLIMDIPDPSKPEEKVVTGIFRLNGHLLGTEKDSIIVSLYQNGKVVKFYEVDGCPIPDPPTSASIQTQLEFKITKDDEILPGNYRIILLVNGQQARKSPILELVE